MTNIMNMLIKLKGCCEHEESVIRSTLGLKPSEYRALALIKPGVCYSNDALSKESGLSKSRGSRVFDRLVKKGYLIRRGNTRDKRSFLYELSVNGITIKNRISQLKKRCEVKILSKITEEQADIIQTGLQILSGIMEVKES
jgi:DNA-binding MarR family transcriptional regulator